MFLIYSAEENKTTDITLEEKDMIAKIEGMTIGDDSKGDMAITTGDTTTDTLPEEDANIDTTAEMQKHMRPYKIRSIEDIKKAFIQYEEDTQFHQFTNENPMEYVKFKKKLVNGYDQCGFSFRESREVFVTTELDKVKKFTVEKGEKMKYFVRQYKERIAQEMIQKIEELKDGESLSLQPSGILLPTISELSRLEEENKITSLIETHKKLEEKDWQIEKLQRHNTELQQEIKKLKGEPVKEENVEGQEEATEKEIIEVKQETNE